MELQREIHYSECPIPLFIQKGCRYIRRHGLKQEGIFRIGGVQNEIYDLQTRLNNGELVDFTTITSVHTVTGLLKMFFRDLPTPILTYTLYQKFLDAVEIKDEVARTARIRDLIFLLPTDNLNIMRELLILLYQLSLHSEESKMDAANLSIVISPNLIWDPTRSVSISFSTLDKTSNLVENMIYNSLSFFPETASVYDLKVQPKSITSKPVSGGLSSLKSWKPPVESPEVSSSVPSVVLAIPSD